MLAELDGRFEDLEDRKTELLADLGEGSDAQLHFRPTPESWSLLQVLEHLLRVEEAVLEQLQRTASASHRRRTPVTRLRFAFLRLVLRSPLRVKAPTRRVLPAGDLTLGEIEASWSDVRRALARRLEAIEAPALTSPVAYHPVAGRLTAVQGLDFLIDHFDHHLRQVERIRRSPGYPAPSPLP